LQQTQPIEHGPVIWVRRVASWPLAAPGTGRFPAYAGTQEVAGLGRRKTNQCLPSKTGLKRLQQAEQARALCRLSRVSPDSRGHGFGHW
jgi:hypothetical protein